MRDYFFSMGRKFKREGDYVEVVIVNILILFVKMFLGNGY